MSKITSPSMSMTARELYKAAYRNARCARSLDPRAKIEPLGPGFPGAEKDRVTTMISYAIEHKENKAYNAFDGWQNISRGNAWRNMRSDMFRSPNGHVYVTAAGIKIMTGKTPRI